MLVGGFLFVVWFISFASFLLSIFFDASILLDNKFETHFNSTHIFLLLFDIHINSEHTKKSLSILIFLYGERSFFR